MKQLSDIIASPLAELINKSFQSGIFPDIFKIAKVILIFKSESRVLYNNYTPIILLSNINISVSWFKEGLCYSGSYLTEKTVSLWYGIRGIANEWFCSYLLFIYWKSSISSKWNINRSSSRISIRATAFPYLHKWST